VIFWLALVAAKNNHFISKSILNSEVESEPPMSISPSSGLPPQKNGSAGNPFLQAIGPSAGQGIPLPGIRTAREMLGFNSGSPITRPDTSSTVASYFAGAGKATPAKEAFSGAFNFSTITASEAPSDNKINAIDSNSGDGENASGGNGHGHRG
jgi:hypothetical protein